MSIHDACTRHTICRGLSAQHHPRVSMVSIGKKASQVGYKAPDLPSIAPESKYVGGMIAGIVSVQAKPRQKRQQHRPRLGSEGRAVQHHMRRSLCVTQTT